MTAQETERAANPRKKAIDRMNWLDPYDPEVFQKSSANALTATTIEGAQKSVIAASNQRVNPSFARVTLVVAYELR